MHQMTVRELKERLDADGEKPLILDVREPWEIQVCALQGAVCIPMRQIPARLAELDPARETVVVCHHGVRSYQVARFLEHQGFGHLHNLSGGIDAWAKEIDRTMGTY